MFPALPLAPWVTRAYHLGVVLWTKMAKMSRKCRSTAAVAAVVVVEVIVRRFGAETYKEVKSPHPPAVFSVPVWFV